MPTYVFHCDKCNIDEEDLLRISEKIKHKCTVCKGKCKQVIQPSNVHLKGNDWPSRDFRKIK